MVFQGLLAEIVATTRQEANRRDNRSCKDREIFVEIKLKGLDIIIRGKTIRRQGVPKVSSLWEEALKILVVSIILSNLQY